ncbi:hypothetical protein [Microbulbifer discodermiae]|uniref:hypothetical protein n=1 Tax=Microbulbifer sp. 2201CG32-9 TaxID=3232309 RepID=UPI00345B86AD
MISDKETAKEICNTLADCSLKLRGTLDLVKSNCVAGEVEQYKQKLGVVLGHLMLDLRDPIYKEHPDLLPRDLR